MYVRLHMHSSQQDIYENQPKSKTGSNQNTEKTES